MVEFEFVPRRVVRIEISKLGSLGIVYMYGGCVVRISESRMWGQQIDEHGEYFLNIECISNPQSPHRNFILCICLALES
jgi:hypothetical protein